MNEIYDKLLDQQKSSNDFLSFYYNLSNKEKAIYNLCKLQKLREVLIKLTRYNYEREIYVNDIETVYYRIRLHMYNEGSWKPLSNIQLKEYSQKYISNL